MSGQPASQTSPSLARINSARAARSAGPLEANQQLDQLAAGYLNEVLASRSFTPSGYGTLDARVLSEDVAAAIGEDGYNYRYVGLVVSYGQNLDNAIGVALGTTANGPALFESAMSQAGIASAPIEEGAAPWIAPPPGGVGRAIELTGLTVVVIVTAGEFRAVT